MSNEDTFHFISAICTICKITPQQLVEALKDDEAHEKFMKEFATIGMQYIMDVLNEPKEKPAHESTTGDIH